MAAISVALLHERVVRELILLGRFDHGQDGLVDNIVLCSFYFEDGGLSKDADLHVTLVFLTAWCVSNVRADGRLQHRL